MASFKSVLSVVLLACLSQQVRACLEDYSPCSCDNSTGIQDIACVNVMANDIQKVFSRTQETVLGSLSITFATADSSLVVPADLVAGKTFIGRMSLSCSNYNHVLRLDPHAFGLSNDFTAAIFYGCNVIQQPDFNFIANFTKLAEISMERMSNFNSFVGLPESLTHVEIANNRGFDNLNNTQVWLPNLKHLSLNTNGLTDTSIRAALDALTNYSTNSLEVLELHDNQLTSIPSSIHLFTKLTSVTLQNNDIAFIYYDSLNFPPTSNLATINLDDNVIQSITYGALKGGITGLSLNRNKLFKFEDVVYMPLLESFDSRGSGSLQVFGNRFECDCDLNWLVRDNRHLLQYIQGGRCSNSTNFEDLSPEGFGGCPTDEFKCPSPDGNYAAGPCSDYYYACSGGNAYVIYCPGGLVYDDWLNMCVEPTGCQ